MGTFVYLQLHSLDLTHCDKSCTPVQNPCSVCYKGSKQYLLPCPQEGAFLVEGSFKYFLGPCQEMWSLQGVAHAPCDTAPSASITLFCDWHCLSAVHKGMGRFRLVSCSSSTRLFPSKFMLAETFIVLTGSTQILQCYCKS